MSLQFRPARLVDANAIAEICLAAFGEPADAQRIQALISLGNNQPIVAEENGVILGFVDSFPTFAHDRCLRWELDLLAVHPDVQGKGIGKQLIAATLADAKAYEVDFLRTLIRADNIPMHHACRYSALICNENICELLVKSSSMKAILQESPSCFVRVDTMTYDGIWLEGEINQAAVESAESLCRYYSLSTVGAVVPQSESNTIALLNQLGFHKIGNYQWWTLNL